MDDPPPIVNKVIFDFDDTLFPSSSCQGKHPINILNNSETATSFKKLEVILIAIFDDIVKLNAELCIITNSSVGWVEYALSHYYPVLYGKYKNIPIIYARHNFNYLSQTDPRIWKIQSLISSIKQQFLKGNHISIISIGDSEVERDAILEVNKLYPSLLIKNIKFIEKPTITQLYYQWNLLQSQFNNIFNYKHKIDMMMKINTISC